jgi:hypothetical protein
LSIFHIGKFIEMNQLLFVSGETKACTPNEVCADEPDVVNAGNVDLICSLLAAGQM